MKSLAKACARLMYMLLAVALLLANAQNAHAMSQTFLDRLAQDEVIYFLLPDRFENGDPTNDRGGMSGTRLRTGFDPTSKAFYHGGDLKGVIQRLSYIQSLGATAIWVAPIFKNKPVQGPPGGESAGYHGYWITDFTHVDPHLGSDADMHALVDAAHARGLKVYMDIITNHTADVIAYRECVHSACAYRSRADYPYTRRGGIGGEPINPGFLGDDAPHQTVENFAKLTDINYAYTPFIPSGEEHLKVPAWLNDLHFYHNRGNSIFKGESSEMGDFAGLDDLMTENPRVVQGFIDIYGQWIDAYCIDGFRIDTAKHVNPEFWQAFVPAMRARAAAHGIINFHIFGEVFTSEPDTALLARHTRVARLPAVLDFALAAAIRRTVAENGATSILSRLFEDDALYEGGAATALQLPTFVSNHDMGRFGFFVRKFRPQAKDAEVLRRVTLAYAMLFTLRGVPVVYYGDEQGFAGLGDDRNAREDMFASRVADFNREHLIGSASTTMQSNFKTAHPLFRSIAVLAGIRAKLPTLRRGVQIVRQASEHPGLFAVSRIDPADGGEVVVAFNTSTKPIKALIAVGADSLQFHSVHGACAERVSAPGSYWVLLNPLDYLICAPGATR